MARPLDLTPAEKTQKKPKERKKTRSMDVVKAAGVVLWRGDRESVELALVHRPKYDDWSFPKGKLEPGERHREAALREAFEETGMTVLLGHRLPTQHYLDRGRIKRVRYWSATRLTGSFTPNREVDALRWLPTRDARALLSYTHDRDLVDALLDLI